MERIEISRIETNIRSAAHLPDRYAIIRNNLVSLSEKSGCNVYVTPFVSTTHLNCA